MPFFDFARMKYRELGRSIKISDFDTVIKTTLDCPVELIRFYLQITVRRHIQSIVTPIRGNMTIYKSIEIAILLPSSQTNLYLYDI